MPGFVELVPASELADGEMKCVELEGHELMIARVGEDYFISDDRCPHLHGDLSAGKLGGTIVTCPRHGSQYDLRDGHVIRWTHFTGPVCTMVELARHPRPLRMYEVLVDEGKVFVGPQKPPPADQ